MYSTTPTITTTKALLARRCKELRKEKKMTQARLSEISGVSLSSLKRFENTGEASLDNILRLAAVLDRLNDFNAIFMPDSIPQSVKNSFDI